MTPIKYIIVKKCGLETAIILHASVSHNQAVNPTELAKEGAELLSAGFFLCDPDLGIIVDDSTGSSTLNLSPRPDDAEIIERTLFLNGIKISSHPSGGAELHSAGTPETSHDAETTKLNPGRGIPAPRPSVLSASSC